ncbi:MAG: hypothetical protein ACRERC_16545, partial [Candidatus Binatia bacterium]
VEEPFDEGWRAAHDLVRRLRRDLHVDAHTRKLGSRLAPRQPRIFAPARCRDSPIPSTIAAVYADGDRSIDARRFLPDRATGRQR